MVWSIEKTEITVRTPPITAVDEDLQKKVIIGFESINLCPKKENEISNFWKFKLLSDNLFLNS